MLEKLAEDEDVPDDVIGFHAQQAAEKLLKAAAEVRVWVDSVLSR